CPQLCCGICRGPVWLGGHWSCHESMWRGTAAIGPGNRSRHLGPRSNARFGRSEPRPPFGWLRIRAEALDDVAARLLIVLQGQEPLGLSLLQQLPEAAKAVIAFVEPRLTAFYRLLDHRTPDLVLL